MSGRVAVVRIGRVLLVTAPAELDDETMLELQEDLCAQVVASGAHGVVFDITAVDVIDTFVGRAIAQLALVVHVLGARAVLVGMRPAVAVTVAHLGAELDGVATARDLDAGLRALQGAARPALPPTR